MSAETWAVVGVGVALGGTMLSALSAIRGDVAALIRDVASMRERMARIEGLIKGWRGGAGRVPEWRLRS